MHASSLVGDTRTTPRGAALYAAAWVPLVAVYAGVLTLMTDGTLSVLYTVYAAMLNTVGPAALGVPVWFVTQKLPWPERSYRTFIAAHAVMAIAYASGWTLWQIAIAGPLGPARAPDYTMLRYVLPWQTAIGFILYGVVAGISYAVRGVTRSQNLRLAGERAERLRAQAELATLRAHINPHFFFNTLHSVSQMLRTDPRGAGVALEQLSSIFRYVLRLDRYQVELVTLDEEWQFTQTYLWLEQLRLGARLCVVHDIDEDVLESLVPPFTLQPLVENAIRHGLAPRPGPGTLTIRATEADGQLVLEVSDDGVGLQATSHEYERGIGSRAVNQRLVAHFGARASTHVVSNPGHGYTVTLRFPAVTDGASVSARVT